MRKLTLTAIVLLMLLFSGCRDRALQDIFSHAEILMESQPDSALRLLRQVPDSARLTACNRAYLGLLTIRACAKSGRSPDDSLLHEVLAYYRGHRDSAGRAEACLYMSRQVARVRKDTSLLHELLFEALDYAPYSGNYNMRGLIYSDIGKVYGNQYKPEFAIPYHLKSLELFRQAGNTKNQAVALERLGWLHMYQMKFDQAEAYFKMGLRLAEAGTDSSQISGMHKSLSSSYVWGKKFDLAKYHALKSFNLSLDTLYPGSMSLLGDIYQLQNRLDSARYWMDRALNLARKNCDTAKIAGILIAMCQMEEKTGNYRKALELSRKGASHTEAVLNALQRNSVTDNERKYRMALLRNERTQLAMQRRNLWLAISVLATVLFAALFYYSVRMARRKRRIFEVEALQQAQQSEYQRMAIDLQHEMIERQKNELQVGCLQARMNEAKYLLMSHLETRRRINMFRLMKRQEHDPGSEQVEQLLGSLSLTPESWDEIARIIAQVHGDLFSELSRAYSQLTGDDLRLCGMIVIGLESSEIGYVLGINTDSVYRKRRRLKKKIGLGEKDSLREHLQKFVSEI